VTTRSISCKNVQSSSQIITKNKLTPSFLTGRMPFLSPNQPLRGKDKRLFLSLRINGHFPGGPGMSPLCTSLELRVMEVVVTIGAVKHAKLQSNHHYQQKYTQLFTGWIPFLSPYQQCQSTE